MLKESTNDESYIQEIESLRTAITKAEMERNKLLHSIWAPADIEGALRTKSSAKAKRGLRVDREVLETSQLRKTSEGFRKVAEGIINLTIDPRVDLPINKID